jgi:hypothetical protein
MTTYLNNYLSGAWQPTSDSAYKLSDPVTGQQVAETGCKAEGLEAGFEFADWLSITGAVHCRDRRPHWRNWRR